jgi:hypothetical protein
MPKQSDAEKMLCRTPTPGKAPTRIDAHKFAIVRRAILEALPKSGAGVRFADLPALVESRLPCPTAAIGSLMWYVTTVKLELEVRGEVTRTKGSPQRLLRTVNLR